MRKTTNKQWIIQESFYWPNDITPRKVMQEKPSGLSPKDWEMASYKAKREMTCLFMDCHFSGHSHMASSSTNHMPHSCTSHRFYIAPITGFLLRHGRDISCFLDLVTWWAESFKVPKACLAWNGFFQSECKFFGVVMAGARPPKASVMASTEAMVAVVFVAGVEFFSLITKCSKLAQGLGMLLSDRVLT